MMDSKQAVEILRDLSWLVGAESRAEIAALIERQERMIEKACEELGSGDCLFEDEPCPKNYIEVGCRGCARRWLEEEAGK